MRHLLPLFAALLCSCAGEMLKTAAGDLYMKGSILENSTSEGTKATLPGGASIVTTKTGKNQTTGPVALAASYFGVEGLKQGTAIVNSNNAAGVANAKTAATLAAQKAALAAKPAAATVVQPGTSVVFPPPAAIPH